MESRLLLRAASGFAVLACLVGLSCSQTQQSGNPSGHSAPPDPADPAGTAAPAGPTGPDVMPSWEVDLNELVTTDCDTEAFRDIGDSVVEAVMNTNPGVPPEAVPLQQTGHPLVSAGNLNNNQVHDCQRLIDHGDSIGARMSDMPLVALLPSIRAVQAPTPSFTNWKVVADIINYGPGKYDHLDIPEGLSCLQIRGDEGTDEWEAAIVPPRNNGCVGALQEDPMSVKLSVRRSTIEDLPSDSFPHTGRWMWDSDAWRNYIGIQCGNGWCEIDMQLRDNLQLASIGDVPGWSDDQLLAVENEFGVLVLSDLHGHIKPGADNTVVEQTRPGDSPGVERHVATLRFQGEPGSRAWLLYADKFNLDIGGHDTAHEILFKTVIFDVPRYMFRSPQGPWRAARRCNVSHSGSGTVRWSWSDQDEGIWVPCDNGCCVVRGW